MILSGLVSGGLRKANSPENFHDLAQEAIFLSPPKYFACVKVQNGRVAFYISKMQPCLLFFTVAAITC